jgi:hypothetical protein
VVCKISKNSHGKHVYYNLEYAFPWFRNMMMREKNKLQIFENKLQIFENKVLGKVLQNALLVDGCD